MYNPLLLKDTAIQIALILKGEDLYNLCSTNKPLLEWICNNPQFWYLKIKQDFGINTHETLNRSGSSEDYKFLYNIKDKNRYTLSIMLMDESEDGNIDHIKLLLINGTNIHKQNETALRLAAQNGHRDVVELLLNYGADIHAENDDALRRAECNNHKDVVKLLLKHGANIHGYDDDHA